jgi:hypothetical protein
MAAAAAAAAAAASFCDLRFRNMIWGSRAPLIQPSFGVEYIELTGVDSQIQNPNPINNKTRHVEYETHRPWMVNREPTRGQFRKSIPVVFFELCLTFLALFTARGQRSPEY